MISMGYGAGAFTHPAQRSETHRYGYRFFGPSSIGGTSIGNSTSHSLNNGMHWNSFN